MRTADELKGPTQRQLALGAASGLGSAVLFGLSTPLAKTLLPSVSPWLLAGLLYLGAGLGLSVVRALQRASGHGEPNDRLQRRDWPRVLAIAVIGGAVGPVLLLFGLTRVSGVAGSLLLNLEAVLTMGLAVLVFGERLGVVESAGALLVVMGAVTVTYAPDAWRTDLPGAMAIAGACLSWAFDNNLTRQLSARNPLQIVQVKTLSAGIGNVTLAAIAGDRAAWSMAPAALMLGFVSYGLSVVLDVYALRYVGAAREAAFFAVAPFAGAVAAIPILHEQLTVRDYGAGVLMAAGIALVVRGRR